MSKYSLSMDELEGHLREQLGRLQRAAQAFDEGYKFEAKNIATILRVLLHSRRFPSLLKQLGREDTKFADSGSPYNPENIATTHRLVSIQFRESGIYYCARLDDALNGEFIDFDEWWSSPIFADVEKRILSRADVVLTAADQDGGAHVDRSLRADYAAISRENSLGWFIIQENGIQLPMRDAEFAAIRQIAHEVLKTLVPRYVRCSADVDALRRPPDLSGGKIRFFPGEAYLAKCPLTEPLIEGNVYYAEFHIESITIGEVRIAVAGYLSDPVHSPGLHVVVVAAGDSDQTGVHGVFTDAVIDSFKML